MPSVPAHAGPTPTRPKGAGDSTISATPTSPSITCVRCGSWARRSRPSYPFAPDSTVARFDLPRPLAPGDSMTVEMQWDARPSTVPRRQGRAGRRFDFAQWYPKVVVYDRYGWEEHPLYPAGEFYGEFGTFLVDLDVPEDEVVGATGVPVCGDPGWERANRNPNRTVEYQRDYYGASTPSADACEGADSRAQAHPMVCRAGPSLRHVAQPRLSLRGRPLRQRGGPRALPAR